MANTVDPLNPEHWKPIVQDYLNNMLVSMKICNVKCEALLSDGDVVNFPYTSDVRVQDYTPGTDLTIDDFTATANSLTVNQSKAATFSLDVQEEKQARAKYGLNLAFQSAFQLKNNIDQTLINTAVTNVGNTVAGGSLTASTLYAAMADVHAQLFRNNAVDGPLFAVLDAENVSLLEQSFVANGFKEADLTLRNGFKGAVNGFNVFVSNNLPYSVDLTMDTIPTATDTMTIFGVTWTWVASGVATNAGEISIGANVADAQANLLLAVNGTGTPGATTYIDVSTENRRTYQNQQVAAGAWAANVSTITAFGRIAGSETFSAATNVFGTETSNMLFGKVGAPSLAIQMQPELYIREEPKQLSKNYITHTLYGTAAFVRDQQRLVALSFNVA